MNKFDKLFKKLIMEFYEEDLVDSDEYDNPEEAIRNAFLKLMEQAWQYAPISLPDQEKQAYIFNTWVDNADDIIEYVSEQLSGTESAEAIESFVREYIINNTEKLFGTDFDLKSLI